MEGGRSYEEDGHPPSPRFPSAMATRDSSIRRLASGENLIMLSLATGEGNKGPTESHDDHNDNISGEAEFDNASAQSRRDNASSDGRGRVDQQKALREEEPKIVARLTPEDEVTPCVPSSHHRRAFSVDQVVAKVNDDYSSSPTAMVRSKLPGKAGLGGGQIDTAAPFESVKAAVSKFGGIVDWKAHRAQTAERRKFIEIELERAQEEMPTYKQQCEAAEEAKAQVLKELDSTKRAIEELKLNLDRAQKEEHQAKQDTDLAELRVEKMEKGIADEASFSAKVQLEVARARHVAAVSELSTVNEELEQLRKDYALLVAEKDAAAKKAEEAVSTSKEVEKSLQDLTIELTTLKKSLKSAHSEHLEVEEHSVGEFMTKEQENENWEEDLKQAEEEIEKLNQKMLSTKELKSKLNEATALLHDLKGELAVYMETKLAGIGAGGNFLLTDNKTPEDIKAAINAAGKELLQVKIRIMKANEEVHSARMESTALKLDLEKEKTELAAIQQREGMASIAVASLEVDLNMVEAEIEIARMKEKEESEKMEEFPKKLEEAGQKTEQAKVLEEKALKELLRAKEEFEQANVGKINKEIELHTAQKNIEASKTSEKLALDAITALEKSESAHKKNDGEDSPTTEVMLSLEEYFELSKLVHEAEEQANARVAAAISEIEAAKESEVRSLNKLEEVSRDMSNRKDELKTAQQKATLAEERKLAVEQELRKWRAEHKQRRKASDQSVLAPVNTCPDGKGISFFMRVPESSSTLHQRSSPKALVAANVEKEKEVPTDSNVAKKKKKSIFPRFFTFMGKKKTQTSKKD